MNSDSLSAHSAETRRCVGDQNGEIEGGSRRWIATVDSKTRAFDESLEIYKKTSALE